MTTTNGTPTAAEPAYVDPFPQAARERVLAALAQAGRQPDADGSESVYIGFIGTDCDFDRYMALSISAMCHLDLSHHGGSPAGCVKNFCMALPHYTSSYAP